MVVDVPVVTVMLMMTAPEGVGDVRCEGEVAPEDGDRDTGSESSPRHVEKGFAGGRMMWRFMIDKPIRFVCAQAWYRDMR